MTPLARPARAAVASAFTVLVLVVATTAHAQIWTENGDAGDLPGSAQTTYGTGPLTQISGSLPADNDVDMYCIQVVDPAQFMAWLNCVTLSQNDIWIFDQAGLGRSRDRGCSAGQTAVGTPIITSPGFYYLAVSGNDASAQNSGSNLWLVGTPASGQAPPNGPAAGSPVNGWFGGVVNPAGAYTIQLSGAGFCDVPLPTRARTWGETKVFYR